ncbi:hypothetical protein [Acidithiobacillus sp.]|uniref:hypothetical protein n=1 Tax=Acidithiobacillus sp. TaxID=1872118 RepID=UPI0025C5D17D|nr:hypothetical protein [Acidithiobacillus sp.]
MVKRTVVFLALASLSGIAIAAGPSTVPNGYYGGYGDNCNVAYHISGKDVVASAFNIGNARSLPDTPETKKVIKYQTSGNRAGYNGTVVKNSADTLVVNFKTGTKHDPWICQRTYRWAGGKLVEFSNRSLTPQACFNMHGGTWSWGSDTKSKLNYFGK